MARRFRDLIFATILVFFFTDGTLSNGKSCDDFCSAETQKYLRCGGGIRRDPAHLFDFQIEQYILTLQQRLALSVGRLLMICL